MLDLWAFMEENKDKPLSLTIRNYCFDSITKSDTIEVECEYYKKMTGDEDEIIYEDEDTRFCFSNSDCTELYGHDWVRIYFFQESMWYSIFLNFRRLYHNKIHKICFYLNIPRIVDIFNHSHILEIIK